MILSRVAEEMRAVGFRPRTSETVGWETPARSATSRVVTRGGRGFFCTLDNTCLLIRIVKSPLGGFQVTGRRVTGSGQRATGNGQRATGSWQLAAGSWAIRRACRSGV